MTDLRDARRINLGGLVIINLKPLIYFENNFWKVCGPDNKLKAQAQEFVAKLNEQRWSQYEP